MRNHTTSIVFKIRQGVGLHLRDTVKTPTVRNVNGINIKPSPAIVAVTSTDARLIYEAAPPSLPRSLFPKSVYYTLAACGICCKDKSVKLNKAAVISFH